jgi:hypothetical protein
MGAHLLHRSVVGHFQRIHRNGLGSNRRLQATRMKPRAPEPGRWAPPWAVFREAII